MWNSFVSTGWATRVPDGPLLNSNIFNTSETNYEELTKWKLDYFVFGFKENIFNNVKCVHFLTDASNLLYSDLKGDEDGKKEYVKPVHNVERKEAKPVKAERGTRRRPTYSAKLVHSLSKDTDTADDTTDTHSEDDPATAKVLRQNKILEYRKTLTKTVKLKTAIFHERVRITCSKDGQTLEWYKGKSDDDSSNKRHPLGNLFVNKITNVKPKVDNDKYLEIYSGNSSYLFMFKTREERDEWHTEFDNFLKFMKLI